MTPIQWLRRLRPVRLIGVMVLVASCASWPGSAAPVLKIGLIAPFEGLGRPLGYAILPVLQNALDAANESGTLGPYRLLLVALNDELSPATAAAQAATLAEDPAVIAVIGPFTMATATAAVPVLARAGIPALVPAPLAGASAGALSLCPSPEQILHVLNAASLSESNLGLATSFSCSDYAIVWHSVKTHRTVITSALSEAREQATREPVVFFPGEATQAADLLLARRATGWTGNLWGGPDVVKPWFVARVGQAGEGTRAVACAIRGAEPMEGLPEAALARASVDIIADLLSAEVKTGREPTRARLAVRMVDAAVVRDLLWYEAIGDGWQPLGERQAYVPSRIRHFASVWQVLPDDPVDEGRGFDR